VKIAALLAIVAAVLTACTSRSELDKVMGRSVEGAPVTQEQRLDCDLIFPGPDHR
jgi:outer membrane biogenesis lipoprotein LolB